MSSYAIPNVGTMTSTGLTDTQVAAIIQSLVCLCLGIDTATDALSGSRVRIDWPVPGQPAWLITDDVAFVRVTEAEEAYNAAHEPQAAGVADDGTYTESTIYTRGWDVYLVFYGPNSFDRARQVKACMNQDFTGAILNESNLYPFTVTGTPRRAPELFENQWWPRTDYSFRMYEQVTDALDKGAVESVEVIIRDEDGNGSDIIVTFPS
jgi:hypothetical protein